MADRRPLRQPEHRSCSSIPALLAALVAVVACYGIMSDLLVNNVFKLMICAGDPSNNLELAPSRSADVYNNVFLRTSPAEVTLPVQDCSVPAPHARLMVR